MKTNIQNLKHIGKIYLEKKHLESPDAERSAELLLSETLFCPHPIDLIRREEENISPLNRKNYFRALKRRAMGEPTSYITESVEFMDIKLRVNQHCLIPRPETEVLVEKVLEECCKFGDTRLNSLKSNPELSLVSPNLQILDIGTGSGNIAISLAHYLEKCQIHAVDISEEALKLARQNANRNKVAFKIHFFKSDLFQSLNQKYDLIVANLPYLNEKELQEAQAELRFEPKEALVSGPTGLELIEKVIDQSSRFLKNGGVLFLEIGYTQGETVKSLFQKNGFQGIEIYKDYAQHDRIAKGTLVNG